MEESELKRMRKREFTDYLDFREYSRVLRDILGDASKVPAVIGPCEWKPENFEVMNISPMSEADRLTVLNYCAGIEELSKAFVIRTRASIYLGVDGRTREYSGRDIFSTGFKLEGVSYDLSVYWDEKREDTRQIVYKATQKEITPEAHKLLRRFRGPNFRED